MSEATSSPTDLEDLPEQHSDQEENVLSWYQQVEKQFADEENSWSENDGADEHDIHEQLKGLYPDSEGEYLTSLQVEPSFELSAYHRSNQNEEDGSDSTTTGKQETAYNSDFYKQHEQIQLGIYAADIVTLKDHNALLQKSLSKESTGHAKFKEECKLKERMITRISKERDTALGEKYVLSTKIAKLEAQLANLRAELESERTMRKQVPEAGRELLERTLVDAKYKLAQYAEQNDDLQFQAKQLLTKNQQLKERSKVERQQLDLLSKILKQHNLSLSSAKVRAESNAI